MVKYVIIKIQGIGLLINLLNKMKKYKSILFFAFLFSILSLNASAADVEYDWVKSIGGTGIDHGYNITTDVDGNIYATGTFTGTVDFDPGTGVANLTSAGGIDIFVLKLNSSGEYVWAKKVGGTGNDHGGSIVLDGDNNVYVAGYFLSTVDFDPGAGTANLISAGGNDIFVLKLNSSGEYLWAKGMGSTGSDYVASIYIDGDDIYATGGFVGTVDFDPGAGTANLISSGLTDAFILRLNSSGEYVWAKKAGGTGEDYGYSIASYGTDAVYLAGSFSGTADFDPGAGTANLISAGGNDIFVLKLNSSGEYVWAKGMGGTDGDISYGVVMRVDSDGNVYTTGDYSGTADFDPGAGTANLVSTGYSDFFISKLNSSGEYVWVKSIGSDYWYDISLAIDLDSDSNVYASGTFWGTVDFDPGDSSSTLASTESYDTFVLKLNSSGEYVWAKLVGGTGGVVEGYDQGSAVSVDEDDNVYVAGYFEGTGDFDPSEDTVEITSAGAQDIFILKLSPVVVPAPVVETRRHSSGGSSPASMAIFYEEQQQRATDAGQTYVIPTTTAIVTTVTPSIDSDIIRTLKNGMEGDDVKTLQAYLNSHGYPLTTTGPGSLDNETTRFGALTHKAVVKFQIANGLMGDGIVGPLTRALLK